MMNSNFTEKFQKELTKFLKWLNIQEFIIKNKNGEIMKIDETLLINYKEPGRNKLDNYIKELINNYIIILNDEEYNDYKLISNNFKNNKVKKESKESNESNESNGSSESIKVKRGRKPKSTSSINDTCSLVSVNRIVSVNREIEKSKSDFICNLDFSFSDLEKAFGKGNWVISLYKKEYCIKKNEENKVCLYILYEGKKIKPLKKDVKEILKYITCKIKKKSIANKEQPQNDAQNDTQEESRNDTQEESRNDTQEESRNDTQEQEHLQLKEQEEIDNDILKESIINDFTISLDDILVEIDDINLDDLQEDELNII